MTIARCLLKMMYVMIITLCVSGYVFQASIEMAQAEPVKLKVMLLPFLSFAPLFIAQEEGLFAEQGLDVEFVRFDRGPEAVIAMARGDLDVWIGAPVASLFSMMRTTRIRMVADKGHLPSSTCSYMTMLTRRELVDTHMLEDPKQWPTRRIVRQHRGDLYEYYLSTALDQVGLKLTEAQLVDVPTPLLAKTFQDKAIDLVPISEPYVTSISQTADVVPWMPAEQIIPNYQFSMVGYGQRLLDQDPDLGKRFMMAYLKAVRQYNQGKTDRNIAIIAGATKLAPEILQRCCWPAISEDGHLEFQTILAHQNWAIRQGYFDPPVLTEDQFWDGRFVEYANHTLETSSK